MTEQEAIERVNASRDRLELADDLEVWSAGRAIVEYLPDPDQPGKPENRVAWVVTLGSDWGFAEVHVDDDSGETLTVVRSA